MSTDPFTDWYTAAGVRGAERRLFREELDQGKVYFPTYLVPYLDHELVRGLDPALRTELTVRHLYQFLLATTHLETRVVNRGAERIANNRAGFDLPFATRENAFKVYCDEGYHALYSLDLVDQIQETTGITAPNWDFGGFCDRLDDSGERLLPGEPVLAQLLQVVVFETLITAVLNQVPNDPTVVTTVRDLTRDHARDEGRHHRFFASFLGELWTNLDAGPRRRAAVALPALISDCLRWDTGPVQRSLELAGLAPGEAKTVAEDVYGGPQHLRDTASATVKLCRSVGVLEQPGAVEAFAAYGLVDGE